MLEHISHILQHICSLERDKPIVVGVSGGPDSLCLFDLLRRYEYPIVVAHLNHGLRQSAGEEEQRLRTMVSASGIPFVSHQIDVKRFAEENRMSIEEGAREARYRFLFEQARERRAQAVLVGHHANDQVETVLMHLLRGAGLAGLRGMQLRSCPNAWSEDIPLIRPLLNIWREEILAYLSERGLAFETDESNTDPSYTRNRLRYELIPYLAGYNPEISGTILRMSELLQGEYELVEKSIETASHDCQLQPGNGYIVMSLSAWKKQPLALQRSLLRKGAALLDPGLRDLDYAAIERAVVYLSSHTSGRRDLISGIDLLIEGDQLFLLSKAAALPDEDWPQVLEGAHYSLEVPGECRLRNGWVLKSHIVQDAGQILEIVVENRDEFRAWMDLGQLTTPLMVRARAPGDRIQLLGMGGQSTKLSDLMINAGLPQRARRFWPVVLSGERIAWVPGLRMGDPFRITPATQRAAFLELTREVPF